MRTALISLLLFFSCHAAQAQIEVRAQYHEPIDLFAIMDGVSGWLFNDEVYQAYWRERFGWSDEDQAVVDRYKVYRDRVFDDRGQYDAAYRAANGGIFATRSSVSQDTDPFAEHFIAARSIEDALARLEDVVTPREAEMLRSFYRHFEPSWRVILEESRSFNLDRAARLDAALRHEGLDAHFDRIMGFFQVEGEYVFNARYVWWPPINRSLADITGRTFFLRNHPENYPDQSHAPGTVIHEAVHYISAHQPPAQKVALTQAFLSRCPIAVDHTAYMILEEPLAVAWGQAAYAKHIHGDPLDPAEQWYFRPLIDVMSRLLWPHIDRLYKTDATIADGVVELAGGHCADLLDISQLWD